MDIYGCSTSWQMNRPTQPELPKAYGQWPAAERAPGPHAMPPPSSLPWSPNGLSWGSPLPPSLVHFTAHTPCVPHTPVVHCKRKGEIEPVIPAKQFISEDKMAAHLSGMHISHEYKEHGDSPPARADAAAAWARGARTVVLADEIKRLQPEPLIPESLLQRLEKPCMSLMVWQPKEGALLEEQEEDSPERGRRRGVLVAEAPPDMDVEM